MQQLLVECAVRAALIAAGTAAVLWILRVKSARARHAAWTGVVVSMLALPAWTAWGPKASVRVLPAMAAPAATRLIIPKQSVAGQMGLESYWGTPKPQIWSWPNGLAALYLLGVFGLLARLGIGTVRARALVRRAVNVNGRLTSPSCAAPITVGWLRSAVILPECWRAWPQAQLEAVLTHENEHVRRRDPLVQWLALLNRAVFWFHPLAWWLERQVSALAEQACDAAVLVSGHDAHDYSEYLLEMARTVVRTGARVNVLGMAMPGSFLPQRIRQILEGRPALPLTSVRRVSLAAGCLVVFAVFAAGAVDHRTPQQPPRPVAGAGALLAVTQATPAAPAPPAPPAPQKDLRLKDRRMLVLYFDMTAMADADRARAVGAAQKYVRTAMRPEDVMAIMVFNGATVQVKQDFTFDRDQLLLTLDHLATGNSVYLDPRKQLTGLQMAIELLGALEGKKALLYFAVPARPGDLPAQIQPLIDAAIRANVAIFPIDASGLIPR